MAIELTRGYLRIRIVSPSLFIKNSFRTHDVGHRGGVKRITGKSKDTGQWLTQSFIFEKKAIKENRESTMRTLTNIKSGLSIHDKREVDRFVKKIMRG